MGNAYECSYERRMLLGPVAYSSCVLDKNQEAQLQYTLCILHLNPMTLTLMHSKNSTEEPHCTTSVFCAL